MNSINQNTDTKTFYFAGGGTGGHIYPAIALAQHIRKTIPDARLHFFCSERPIDSRILSNTDFSFTKLPAKPFGKKPLQLWRFFKALKQAKQLVKNKISQNPNAVMISIGGFVSAGAVLAAKELDIPVFMLNIDAVAGKANKFLARYAKKVFVQFEITKKYFRKKAILTGAPLREEFYDAAKTIAVEALSLNAKKKTLLITGASAGSTNINNTIALLLDRLESFAPNWQVVHIAGVAGCQATKTLYKSAKISNVILDFYDDMPHLLAAADLVIARAGAMSLAEFAASATPAICLPYPYHRDNHQRINAEQLERKGCCKIVPDLCDTQRTAQLLWPELSELMGSGEKLRAMKTNLLKNTTKNAAAEIVNQILS